MMGKKRIDPFALPSQLNLDTGDGNQDFIDAWMHRHRKRWPTDDEIEAGGYFSDPTLSDEDWNYLDSIINSSSRPKSKRRRSSRGGGPSLPSIGIGNLFSSQHGMQVTAIIVVIGLMLVLFFFAPGGSPTASENDLPPGRTGENVDFERPGTKSDGITPEMPQPTAIPEPTPFPPQTLPKNAPQFVVLESSKQITLTDCNEKPIFTISVTRKSTTIYVRVVKGDEKEEYTFQENGSTVIPIVGSCAIHVTHTTGGLSIVRT